MILQFLQAFIKEIQRGKVEVYNENINIILEKTIVKEMIEGFKNNKKCQELCKHCNFLETEKK